MLLVNYQEIINIIYLHPYFYVFKAVNKLAEIMNRKEPVKRGNDTDVRRKEKENRKLHMELKSEREKLTQQMIKYQKELNEMVFKLLLRNATYHVCIYFIGYGTFLLIITVVSPYARGLCSRIPSECLKPQILLNYIPTMYFPAL